MPSRPARALLAYLVTGRSLAKVERRAPPVSLVSLHETGRSSGKRRMKRLVTDNVGVNTDIQHGECENGSNVSLLFM